ncbi:MAG: hypothetical protein AVDCRST_MAG77-326, partial [uncultured Chloroflexi bacterium]
GRNASKRHKRPPVHPRVLAVWRTAGGPAGAAVRLRLPLCARRL